MAKTVLALALGSAAAFVGPAAQAPATAVNAGQGDLVALAEATNSSSTDDDHLYHLSDQRIPWSQFGWHESAGVYFVCAAAVVAFGAALCSHTPKPVEFPSTTENLQ